MNSIWGIVFGNNICKQYSDKRAPVPVSDSYKYLIIKANAMKSGSLVPLFITFAVLCLIAIGLTLWLYFDDGFRTSPEAGNAVIDLNQQFQEDNARNAEVARRVVKSDGVFDLSIERFLAGMKRYPRSLEELQEKPKYLTTGERWSGPYINNPDLLTDPWGNPFQYLSPGLHNPVGYDFWSNGADGLTGTADDVGNW
ncbi:MAG: hypothetical protein DHS20C16_25650 [Phycisphaerae bacterium]|nr:MAG: hypothetical protein DHS20C16_25650 [Phycisphaerae bacterium]